MIDRAVNIDNKFWFRLDKILFIDKPDSSDIQIRLCFEGNIYYVLNLPNKEKRDKEYDILVGFLNNNMQYDKCK